MIYGLLVGLVYALFDRLLGLTSSSIGPAEPRAGGAGLADLALAGAGIWRSGLAGGLAFSRDGLTGNLTRVAGLVGSTSPVLGFVVHVIISMIIGMTFGALFEHEAPSTGAAIAWGWCMAWPGGSSVG
ncbi:MAG: hypothetical protein U0841_18885 [Chloroflexia bacterium]